MQSVSKVTILIFIIYILGCEPVKEKEPKMEMKPGLLSKFSKVKIGMKYDEVVELVGEPTDAIGSGMTWYQYKIDEGWYIGLFYGSESKLISVDIVDYPGKRRFELE
jgi:hypothetical protein